MFPLNRKPRLTWWWLVCIVLSIFACGNESTKTLEPDVPRGYVPVVALESNGMRLRLGPFVGYYFAPITYGDLTRLKFICLNERSFYTRDLPENARLFVGDAVWVQLPEVDFDFASQERIYPVFFNEAPSEWLATRPEPQDEFIHFHSCYDSQAHVWSGFWIRHEAVAEFVYDMGGRVGPSSPLYHKVTPGIDKAFARIMEFDRGPE
jgi:hypothetical protein